MLKEAINKIQELIVSANKEVSVEINGDTYTERDLSILRPNVPKRRVMELNGLTSLVSNLKNNIVDKEKVTLPLRIIVKEQEVNVFSDLDVNYDREHLFRVYSEEPQISFNTYMDVERMIIQLQTCFVESENKSNLIQMISRLKKDNSIEMADDGVTQIVQLKQGVSSTSEVKVPPLVKLTPIRTFFEVNQPTQLFLVRIDSNGSVALYDAGGGVWKHDCQKAIRNYLNAELKEFIEEGAVVVG